jgi:hypothetical protein
MPALRYDSNPCGSNSDLSDSDGTKSLRHAGASPRRGTVWPCPLSQLYESMLCAGTARLWCHLVSALNIEMGRFRPRLRAKIARSDFYYKGESVVGEVAISSREGDSV